MDILVHDHHRVLHLVLNRPTKRNALTLQMCKDIINAVRTAETRNDIGCVLISANGSVFCSGMDVAEAVPADELLQVHEQLFTLGAQSLKPLVIAVNGAALAGGLGLAAQGHVILASPQAVFGLPELRIGFWPFLVFRSVEAALGRRRTLQLALTGHTFDSHTAMGWGLVHQIHDVAEIHHASLNVAHKLAKSSPLAVAAGMQYVRDSQGKSLSEAGEIAAKLRAGLVATDDFKEGSAAFQEKREPRWPSMPLDFYADGEGPADNS